MVIIKKQYCHDIFDNLLKTSLQEILMLNGLIKYDNRMTAKNILAFDVFKYEKNFKYLGWSEQKIKGTEKTYDDIFKI